MPILSCSNKDERRQPISNIYRLRDGGEFDCFSFGLVGVANEEITGPELLHERSDVLAFVKGVVLDTYAHNSESTLIGKCTTNRRRREHSGTLFAGESNGKTF